MAGLVDCAPGGSFEPEDNSLVVDLIVEGTSLVRDGVSFPAIAAYWSEDSPWFNSPYISGFEFEYGPSDLSAGPTRSAVQGKQLLSWTTTDGVIGGSYTVRYRAYGIKSIGPWSAPDVILVPSLDGVVDSVPPTTPVGLNLVSSTVPDPLTGLPVTKVVATWAANTEPDMAGYTTQFTPAGGQPVTGTVRTPRAEWVALSGSAYTVRVLAFDKSGNVSPYSGAQTITAGQDVTAPAAPTGFSIAPAPTGGELTWIAPADTDVSFIEVYESTTTTMPGSPVSEVACTAGAAGKMTRVGLAPGSIRYFWLRARDFSNNRSPATGPVSLIVPATYAFDTTPPAVPTGLIASNVLTIDPATGSPRTAIDTAWNAGVESDLAGYDLEVQPTGGNAIVRVTTTNRDQILSTPGQQYTFRVRSYDRVNNKSAWSAGFTITAGTDTAAPAPPSIVSVSMGLNQAYLSSTAPGDSDQSKIIFYESPTNDSSTAYQVATVNAGPGAIGRGVRAGLPTGAALYYWARAVDTSGNPSGFSSGSGPFVVPPVTNADVVVGSLHGDRITGNTLLGSALLSTSSLPATLSVSGTGFTLSTLSTTAQAAATNASTSITRIDGIQSDGILSPFEKSKVIEDWNAISGEFAGLAAQASALLIGTELSNYSAATAALSPAPTGYLSTLDPAWNDLTQDTPIVGNTFRQKFVDYYNARQALVNVMVGLSPAGRINNETTLVQSGKILVAGSSYSLQDQLTAWRDPGDITLLDGGAVSANSLNAQSLQIGQRGVQALSIVFEPDDPGTNYVSWTAGTIRYINDSGTGVGVSVSAGSALYSGSVLYIYWAKDALSLVATASYAVASGPDKIILATYAGGTNLDSTYGRTIITPEGIRTPSLSAISSDVGEVTAGILRSPTDSYRLNLLGGAERQTFAGGVAHRGESIGLSSEGIYLWVGPSTTTRGDARKSNAWMGLSMNTVGGGRFFGNGIVGTPNVEDNAITEGGSAYSSSMLSLTGTGETTIQSWTVTTQGEELEVRANFFAQFWHPGGGGFNVTTRIYRTDVEVFSLTVGGINGDQLAGWQTPEITDQPAAGTYTYYVTVQLSTNDGWALRDINSRRLSVRKFKK